MDNFDILWPSSLLGTSTIAPLDSKYFTISEFFPAITLSVRLNYEVLEKISYHKGMPNAEPYFHLYRDNLHQHLAPQRIFLRPAIAQSQLLCEYLLLNIHQTNQHHISKLLICVYLHPSPVWTTWRANTGAFLCSPVRYA